MEDILKPELDWAANVVSGGIKVTTDYDYVEYELLDLSGRQLSKGTFSYESVIPYQSTNGTMILTINTINGTGVKKIAVQK